MIRNILTNFSARLGVAAINFIMLLLTTHLLGVKVRGEIATLQLGINIIHLVGELAGGPSLIYLVPRTSRRMLYLLCSAWGIGSALLIGMLLIALDLLPAAYTAEILIIAILISLHSLNQNMLLGQERIRLFNYLHFSQGILQLIVMVACILLFGQEGAWPFIYANIAGYGICCIAGFWLANRKAPQPHLIEKKPILLVLFRNGIFTQAASLGFMLSLRWSYYLLEKLPEGESAVGIYSTALSLGEAILLLASSAAAVTLARVSNRGDHTAERSTVLRLSKFCFALTAMAIVVFLLLPADFYTWLIGKDFSQIKDVFVPIAPGILLVSFGTVYGHYFSGAGKHYINFLSSLVSLTLVAIFVPVLIRAEGMMGAGWSATIAYGSISVFVFAVFMLIGSNKKEWKLLLPRRDDLSFLKQSMRKNP
jgi:O-antigen/teichoic acid export membrane protein